MGRPVIEILLLQLCLCFDSSKRLLVSAFFPPTQLLVSFPAFDLKSSVSSLRGAVG